MHHPFEREIDHGTPARRSAVSVSLTIDGVDVAVGVVVAVGALVIEVDAAGEHEGPIDHHRGQEHGEDHRREPHDRV